MNVTINTDASYCHKSGAAGFACWIVCNNGRIHYSSVLKSVDNSMDAELKAIANAVFLLKKSTLNQKNITAIFINTDCKAAIEKIGRKSENKVGKYIAKELSEIFKQNKNNITPKKRYQLRHVKAHSGVNDSRSFVNEWCDINAKLMMRKQREYIYKSKRNK